METNSLLALFQYAQKAHMLNQNKMTITGIIGGMSSGKTLILTKFLFDDFNKGRMVFSNFDLKFSHEIISQKDILDYATQEKKLYDSSIGLDEIYLYVDSRLSSRKVNRIYSYFALQTSKRDVNLYYTAQNFHSVDKRIRDNTHEIIQCYPLIKQNKKFKIFFSEKRILSEDELNNFYIYIVIVKRFSFGFNSMIKTVKKLIRAKPYSKLYDTKEIIKMGEIE